MSICLHGILAVATQGVVAAMIDVKCSVCDTTNPPAARFCMECGKELGFHCFVCGWPAPRSSRYCGQCGVALAEESTCDRAMSPSFPIKANQRVNEHTLERRPVTVLFVDLVGSTELSTQLDDEDYKDTICRYRDACATAIRRYDGTLVKYFGDGLLICFGYPVSHEDD